MNNKITRQAILSIMIMFLILTLPAPADYRILHHFTGGSADGSLPIGSPIESDSVIYGMTMQGGSHNNGIIFKINTDGTGFEILRSFVSASSGGQRPYGAPLSSGSVLYGMAASENTSYGGTLFRIGKDGSDFQILHSFAGPTADGRWPYDSVILSGSTLFGMTAAGGAYDNGSSCWGGTIFKINTDATGYQVLHHFSGTGDDGKWAPGNLTRSGSVLYGMTFAGGSSNLGIIFKINTDGSVFQTLHSFTGTAADGAKTHGSLLLLDSKLYGMTREGGSSNKGVIFRINTDGTDFQILHSFTAAANDGGSPMAGSLISLGSTLYGMTNYGGAHNKGTVFEIDSDGSGFSVLHSFAGTSSDGANPFGSLIPAGPTLYGMTSAGGTGNIGTIFALDLEFADCNEVKAAGFRLDADVYGDGDCHVDLYDFSVFARQWLYCNDPQDANCIPNW